MSHKPLLQQIQLDQLHVNPYQPRQKFSSEELAELAHSIKNNGLIQPIVVRQLNHNTYQIIAGERRWRAAQLARFTHIDCLVHVYTDEQAATIAAIENIIRVNLNPMEEAHAYERLIQQFDYTHEDVAAVIGKSRTAISNSLRLLKLHPDVQTFLINEQLSEGHGKILAGLPTHTQKILAQKCIDHGWNVRQIEKEAKKLQTIQAKETTVDPNLRALENTLSDTLGCKVHIDFENQKGQLKIDFHTLEILEGILEKIGVRTL